MKILSIQVDGFGVWSGLKLDGLGDRLTCFYGPNEAGKTTLMQFVRTVLYGFSPERRRRYLPPLRGGEAGGLLQLSGPMGRCALRRRLQAGPRAAECGDVQLLAADGTQLSDHLLGGLLGHLDETTFSQVFAIGLGEIQQLGTLSDSAAADLLYQLSTGLPGVSLAEVMRELESSRDRLLGPDHRPGHIVGLLAQRDRLRGEIEELRGLAHRHASLAGDLHEIEQQIGRREAERHEMQHSLRTLELAVAVREAWRRRAMLASELATLPPIAPVPAGAIERLDQLNERLATRRRQATEASRARRELKTEVAALGFNARLARQAPRIEALVEQETWLATLEEQVEQVSGTIAKLEAELAQHQRDLGEDSHAHGQAGARGKLLARLRPVARALAGPRGRARLAGSEAAECRGKADELATQIRAALAECEHDELAPALEQAGNLVTLLRRRVQADERLAQLGRHETELAEQGRQLLERQLLPVWVLLALGGVFVVGAMLILATLFISLHAVSVTGWGMAIVGALGTVGGACGKFLLERSAAAQLDACQKQSGILASQVTQIKEERETLDRQLPHGGGPLLTRLQTAEKELARLEELLGVEARRQATLEAAAAAEARGRAAEEEGRAAERRWRQALAAAGLPKRLSPRQVRHYADRRRAMARIEVRLERGYQELGERQRDLDTLTRRTEQLLSDVGLEPAAVKPTEQLRQLKQLLADHQAIAASREALGERARRLRRRQAKLALAIRQGEQRRGELLSSAGAAHEHDLRGRAAEQARRQALASERDELAREIAAALAGRAAEEELAPWLDHASDRDWEQRLSEADSRLQTADRELAALLDERGRARQQLVSLAEDRRPGQRALELSLVERQLQDAVDRWRALALSASMLDSVRQRYEAERQPETLIDASRYLSQLTGGRYTRVWTPLGEQTLRVDDAEGNSLPVEVLSRGTREQLFLGLRLALAGVYARRGTELPLVLDDVLVNFDGGRAKAAATVLRDFAEAGHQVLVFTCHEHLWKLFKQLQVPSHELPANDELDPVTLAYARPEPECAGDIPGDNRPAAAFWLPDDIDGPSLEPIIEIAEDDADDFEPPGAADDAARKIEPARPKRRARKSRKPKAARPGGRIENRESRIEEEPAEIAPPDEATTQWATHEPNSPPHRVTVVRPRQLQHPFADAMWHQIVDDDDDDEPELERRSSLPAKGAAGGTARSAKSSGDLQRGPAERPMSNSPPDGSSGEDDDENLLDDDLFDAPSDDDLFRDSDDWSGLDGPDDENEAA